MLEQIKNSKAYKKLNQFQKDLAIRRNNRLQIEDAVITARAIGLAVWKENNALPNNWRAIVEEIA
ncbi:hypothetical protein Q765_00335 [Flavobacterium rivuli WB 3.3-2 = DSM 21788]|uniref:Uncharacterized protein n=1 Tax=Flavobacterium rivuli WB 3.3-2 = DSM 21788 TaxID=1121895 RepID=A0A0A2M7Z4_9FLAO|nr:hypothetical protein [Flavobacterium rivuli]KGO88399.1 hypothetical protein Q765_00335 [Flavobacterium rivuli WB 3.3-2 = DSM 21788]